MIRRFGDVVGGCLGSPAWILTVTCVKSEKRVGWFLKEMLLLTCMQAYDRRKLPYLALAREGRLTIAILPSPRWVDASGAQPGRAFAAPEHITDTGDFAACLVWAEHILSEQ